MSDDLWANGAGVHLRERTHRTMADTRSRAPFGRLQANTIAKEGSTVSPPAKAPVNRLAGPALQASV